MLTWATADCPGTGGSCRTTPGDLDCEEILSKQPAGTGSHVWIRLAKVDLTSQQCRAALARSGTVPEERIAMAGSRDRKGRCVQWFSIPSDAIEHPAALRTTGYKSSITVLEVTASHKPMSAELVQRLRWTVRIRGGARDDGYRKAMATLKRLRVEGCPNFVAASRLGKDGSFAKWGKMVAQGRRLPEAVSRKVNVGQCLFALQASLFNRYLAQRIGDGLLARVIGGERIRNGQGEEELVEDIELAQKRMESWEATPLGPMFGRDMAAVSDEAQAREKALLESAGLDGAALARLHGGRRAIRFQPARPLCDIDKDDLILTCECPSDGYISVLMEEIIKPDRHMDL
jgi:tRNA pseudouridine13 synthase